MIAGHEIRVLLVDDDVALLRAYGNLLRLAGCWVEAIASPAEAVAKIDASFDVVVSDVSMPEMNGLDFLRAVRRRDLDIPVILMTGQPGLESAMRAIEYGAFRYLPKPVERKTLEDAVRRAFRLHSLARLKRQALELQGAAFEGPGDRAGLETRFDRAIERLWLAYQPIVSWRDRQVFGYEALLRSAEPTLSGPAQILDAAERLGRLHDLGRAIRDRVASQASGAPDDAKLFVNLHADDLNDDDLYASDAPLCAIAERIVFEITERASLDSVDDVDGRVRLLRDKRFRIAVDDLGAGYAGLTSFTLLEPTIVKLDMSLIRDVDTNARKQSIVRAMSRLCEELEIAVIAEGVETPSERDALTQLGCDLLQGYLFSRPEREFVNPTW